jgi:fluoride exporter
VNALAWALVAPAGALGALARHGTGRLMAALTGLGAPWGVMVVNLAGAFLVGLVAGLGLGHGPFLVLALGFLGSYTTFSAWMVETDALLERRRYVTALINVVGPAIGGFMLVAAGIAAGVALS